MKSSGEGKDGKPSNKYRTYKGLKHGYDMELYLDINMPSNYTRALAKLRVSDHDLEVERAWKSTCHWRKGYADTAGGGGNSTWRTKHICF